MDQYQQENSSNEEDVSNEEEIEEEAHPEDNYLLLSNIKLTATDLKRRPIRDKVDEASLKTELKQYSPRNKKNVGKKSSSLHTSSTAPSESSKLLLILCCFALLIAVAVTYTIWTKSQSHSVNKQIDVKELIKDLRSEFDGQPSLTYRVIESAVQTASSDHLDSPGIIVLISSREVREMTNKLADRLVQLVSEPYDSVIIDSDSSATAKRLKKNIDVMIQGNLTQKQTRAVLVRNLDRIPFEAAMIFHSYCDHENAPFKRAVYVMTALVDEKIPPSSDIKHWDELASKHLRAAWSDSGEDQVASLISRLTANVAAVVTKE